MAVETLSGLSLMVLGFIVLEHDFINMQRRTVLLAITSRSPMSPRTGCF